MKHFHPGPMQMDRFLSPLYAVTFFANLGACASFLSLLLASGNPVVVSHAPVLAAFFGTVAMVTSATTWAMTR
jgi:hypothetical protein